MLRPSLAVNLRGSSSNAATVQRFISTSGTSIFTNGHHAEFLGAAGSPASIPALHGLPEVIVAGRANVGKSTLLNAILGRTKLLNTSKKAGRTQTLNFYRVGAPPGKLVVVDAPGYGARGRPEWGQLFDHYVDNRAQLKRIYILFNARHGLNDADKMMLRLLDERVQAQGGASHTLQAVITKIDGVPLSNVRETIRQIRQDVFEAAPTCLPPLVTSAAKHPHFGVQELRANMIDACGLGKTSVKRSQN